jgi:hypothetical protein
LADASFCHSGVKCVIIPRPIRVQPSSGASGAKYVANAGKIVVEALLHQTSGSRTDNRIRASGKALLISDQNGAAGQSTVALYPSKKLSHAGTRPS